MFLGWFSFGLFLAVNHIAFDATGRTHLPDLVEKASCLWNSVQIQKVDAGVAIRLNDETCATEATAWHVRIWFGHVRMNDVLPAGAESFGRVFRQQFVNKHVDL